MAQRPIETIKLRTAMRGYEKQHVEEVISALHAQVSRLTAEVQRLTDDLQAGQKAETDKSKGDVQKLTDELKALREENERNKQAYSTLLSQENAVKDALITAQKAAEDVRTYANEQAEAIIEEARQKAEEVVRDYEAKIADLQWELERLRIEKDRFVRDYRTLIENHLRVLNESSTPDIPVTEIPITAVTATVIEVPLDEPHASVEEIEEFHEV